MAGRSVGLDRGGTGQFRIGDALSHAIGLFGRHCPMVVTLSVPAAVASMALGVLVDAALALDEEVALALLGVGSLVLSATLYAPSQAIVAQAMVPAMRARPVRFGQTLSACLPRLVPIVQVSLLKDFLAGAGMLLLVAPGLMLLTTLLVAVPACAVERLGLDASLSRSAWLTKGHRWRLFGLSLTAELLYGVVAAALPVLLQDSDEIVSLAIETAWNAVTLAFWSVLCAVVYYDLRVLKEGADLEQAAAVLG